MLKKKKKNVLNISIKKTFLNSHFTLGLRLRKVTKEKAKLICFFFPEFCTSAKETIKTFYVIRARVAGTLHITDLGNY
jgi:hypothetical protein